MPYTYKALASVWVFLLILFGLSASDLVTGPWILVVVAAAFAAPLTLSLWPKPRYDAVTDRPPMVPR
jgi:hypothetical protein